jgi:Transposase IS66 family
MTTPACECCGWRANGRTNARACSPAASCPPARVGRLRCTSPDASTGENIADVLQQRAKHASPPIQMCDALSRNVPKLAAGVEILLANCLAHGRRQFVEVVANFPDECRYVLEMLGQVYGHDAEAREWSLTPDQRLQVIRHTAAR